VNELQREMEQELLDLLLTPLTPAAKSENPSAFTLAATVINKCSGKLSQPLVKFFNDVLVDQSDSELAEHVYPLIFETHKLAPSLLLDVIPNICVHLEAEELDIRLRACKFLGRLFASEFADYARNMPKQFKAYLGRFQDKDASVLREMVEFSSVILKKKPHLCHFVEEPLAKKLKDPDNDVRYNALSTLMKIAFEDLNKLQVSTLQLMGERVKDKRDEIRKLALLGLCKLYHRYISSQILPAVSGLKDTSSKQGASSGKSQKKKAPAVEEYDGESSLNACLRNVSTGAIDRLNTVPSLVIGTFGCLEQYKRHEAITVLQEFLLPKTFYPPDNEMNEGEVVDISAELNVVDMECAPTQAAVSTDAAENSASRAQYNKPKPLQLSSSEINSRRVAAAIFFMSRLNNQERTSLGGILALKARVRIELEKFLTYREQWLELSKPGPSSHESNGDTSHAVQMAENAMRVSLYRLMEVCPSMDKRLTSLEGIIGMKYVSVWDPKRVLIYFDFI
jgi:hypothetical protein